MFESWRSGRFAVASGRWAIDMVSRETLALTPGVIRDALRTRLLGQYGPGSGAVMVGELGLCQGRARIDLAVVGAELHGYEIKSPADSLRRLGDQAALYGRVFDRLTLVCGRRHVVPALEMLPSWWLTGVCKNEIIATNRPTTPGFPPTSE